jgi:hypothetical protein
MALTLPRMRPPGRPGYSQGPAGCDRGPRSELDAAHLEPCPPVLRSLPPAQTFACRQRTPIRRLRHRRGCRHSRGTVLRSAQPRTGQLSTTTSSGYSSTSHTYPGPHGLAYPGEYVRGPGRAARRWPQPGHARRPHHLHPPPARQRRHPLHAKSGTTCSHGWPRLPTHGWPRLPTRPTTIRLRGKFRETKNFTKFSWAFFVSRRGNLVPRYRTLDPKCQKAPVLWARGDNCWGQLGTVGA